MKQQTTPDVGHQPSTVAEISAVLLEVAELKGQLVEVGRRLYEASRRGGAPAAPISEHDRRVGKHLQKYLNGATPPRFLGDANLSQDAENRAHIDALDIYSRELMKRREAAIYAEAEKWAADNAKEWCELCRAIVLTAERLAALEENARRFLAPIDGVHIKIAMGSTIASGLSLLGVGDPLKEMREAALKENIVSDSEIRKAQKL
jgi:hypothetical protein